MRINDPKGMTCPYRMRKCPGADCPLYVQIVGTDPNTGDMLNQGACAQAASLAFLMQIAQNVDGVQKATESARNDNTNMLGGLGSILVRAVTMNGQKALPPG